MLDLDAVFNPDAVEADMKAIYGLPVRATAAVCNWSQKAAALLATIPDDMRRVAMRDSFEERAAICEYEGNLPRGEAEMIAFREIRDTLATWRK